MKSATTILTDVALKAIMPLRVGFLSAILFTDSDARTLFYASGDSDQTVNPVCFRGYFSH
jgi:hypothetical protein